MVSYWQHNFLPSNVFSVEFLSALLDRCWKFIKLLGYYQYTIFIVPLYIYSLIVLYKKRKDIFFLLVMPFILHLTLAYLKLYPIEIRLTLYLIPLLSIIVSSSFLYISSSLKNVLGAYSYLFILMPLLPNLYFLSKANFEKEDVKGALTYLNDKVNKDDAVYVYYASMPAFKFYKNDFQNIDNNSDKVRYGQAFRNDKAKYCEDITLSSKSVWVVFSHVFLAKNKKELREDRYIINCYENSGFKNVDSMVLNGASVYKFSKL